MNRFKYRVWDKELKTFNSPNVHYFSKEGENCQIKLRLDVLKISGSDRFIIQQFTGLQDKDSVDIYEGDIISGICLNDGPICCVVGFDTFGIYYTKLKNHPSEPYENCACLAQEYSEVIGNIFEDVHLLNTEVY